MKTFRKTLRSLALTAGLLGMGLSGAAGAEGMLKRSFCVFDPVGANGPLFNIMKTAKTAAMQWGVDLNLRAYTDEKVAAEEFKAGQCDSVLLTGTRAREFNKFTGSLEALGAIPGEKEMRMILQTLNQPKAAELLVEGKYEVAGILPAGSVYLFMRDRSIDSVEDLQGKKVATLDYDNASVTMVRHVGASVVGSSSANFAGKFNNGSVDLAYAPAVAYMPLELYKGVEPNGGIYNYRLAQMNFQILINRERFPDDYADKVRNYSMERIDEAYKIIADAEKQIPEKYWIHPSPQQVQDYNAMMREVRISLRDEGTYSAKALRLMRVIRCKTQPTRGECALAME